MTDRPPVDSKLLRYMLAATVLMGVLVAGRDARHGRALPARFRSVIGGRIARL